MALCVPLLAVFDNHLFRIIPNIIDNWAKSHHYFMSSEYVPYSQRPEWADVVPILQDDGPETQPVVQIPYTPKCTWLMTLFLNHLQWNHSFTQPALLPNSDCSTGFLWPGMGLFSPVYFNLVKDTMNYFRALLRTKEKSHRALQICTAAIELSPPNYTAWRYRRYGKILVWVLSRSTPERKNDQF